MALDPVTVPVFVAFFAVFAFLGLYTKWFKSTALTLGLVAGYSPAFAWSCSRTTSGR